MNRKSVACSVVIGIRTDTETRKFEELASGWELTYAATFEKLVKQAEHRNEKRKPK